MRKSSKQYIPTFLILQGPWAKLIFYFQAWKIGRKQHAVWTLILCSFMLCLKSRGLTSAGENLETPPGLCGCLPAGDRLLPPLLFASLLVDPRRARNQSPGHGKESNKAVSNIKLQQENEHVWVWTYWWMQWLHTRVMYFFKLGGPRKFSQTIFFANHQISRMVQLIQWVWIIISGFLSLFFFWGTYGYKNALKII